MKKRFTKQIRINNWSLPLLAMLFIVASANAQVKLDYKNYLVAPNIIYSYQAANGGVTVPVAGTNKVWDYSTLVNMVNTVAESYVPETNSAFSTGRRQRIFSEYFGAGFYATAYEHSNSTTAAYTVNGQHIKRAAYSLGSITGNTSDSLIVPTQTIFYSGNKLAAPYPVYYPASWLYTYSYSINLQISLASQGLNHSSLVFTTSVSDQRDIVGWGNMRIPTVNGLSNYIACLMQKSNRTQVDSFYVNNVPANAAVLTVLGFTQGQTTHKYIYSFKRPGIEQDLITFFMTNSTYTVVDKVLYDRKRFDLYCNNDNCHAKMCLNGSTNVCLAYSTNAANNALLLNNACFGECEALRLADENTAREIGSVQPNPSNNQFTLLVNDNTKAEINIVDFSGRTIYKFAEVTGSIEFGNKLSPGIYFVMIQSGDQKQVVKILKTE